MSIDRRSEHGRDKIKARCSRRYSGSIDNDPWFDDDGRWIRVANRVLQLIMWVDVGDRRAADDT